MKFIFPQLRKLCEGRGVLDREKLELLKRKAAQAESTEKVLTERELTPAERERAIKEIYGCA